MKIYELAKKKDINFDGRFAGSLFGILSKYDKSKKLFKIFDDFQNVYNIPIDAIQIMEILNGCLKRPIVYKSFVDQLYIQLVDDKFVFDSALYNRFMHFYVRAEEFETCEQIFIQLKKDQQVSVDKAHIGVMLSMCGKTENMIIFFVST